LRQGQGQGWEQGREADALQGNNWDGLIFAWATTQVQLHCARDSGSECRVLTPLPGQFLERRMKLVERTCNGDASVGTMYADEATSTQCGTSRSGPLNRVVSLFKWEEGLRIATTVQL